MRSADSERGTARAFLSGLGLFNVATMEVCAGGQQSERTGTDVESQWSASGVGIGYYKYIIGAD